MAPFSSFANYTPKPGHYDEVLMPMGRRAGTGSGLPGRLGALAALSCRVARRRFSAPSSKTASRIISMRTPKAPIGRGKSTCCR